MNSLHFEMLADQNCLGNVWNETSAPAVERMHREFISKIRQNKNADFLHFPQWVLNRFERCSINCISWLGQEFHSFDGNVGEEEEQWLSVDKPKSINKPNIIFGEAVCAHFSFFTQRYYLDQTNILEEYDSIAGI